MDKKFNEINVPKIFLYRHNEELRRFAHQVANNYSGLFPTLARFGLLNEENIRKYLAASSWEIVYSDAMKLNKNHVSFLENCAKFVDNNDFWKPMRAKDCEVSSPSEPGFRFAYLPFGDPDGMERKKSVLPFLIVKGTQIGVNEQGLMALSMHHLTGKERELYLLVREFCNELDKRGLAGRTASNLFLFQRGKLIPNVLGIAQRYSGIIMS